MRGNLCAIAALVASQMLTSGCLMQQPEDGALDIPSWEEFRDDAKVPDAEGVYLVEWDIPLTLDKLREYYDANVANGTDGESPPLSSYSAVNTVGGADDVWRNGEQSNLTYCVTTNFGSRYQRAVNEMAAAASAWEQAANVNFVHLIAEDGNCNLTNTRVLFSVQPQFSGGARAFFPSDLWFFRSVLIDYNDFDTNPEWDVVAPNLTTTGVLRHELGHVLGLRHEHIRQMFLPPGCSFENREWAGLTPYDRSSVMHYQWCGGIATNDLAVTAFDARGARWLYPKPLSRVRGEFTSCDNNRPRFVVDWFSPQGRYTNYEVEINTGSGWRSFYNGSDTGVVHNGLSGRRDWFRARACGHSGLCTPRKSTSVRWFCENDPF